MVNRRCRERFFNWILIDSSGGPNGSFDGIIFSKSQPQVGILLSDPPAGTGNPYLLLKTTNGGNNWTRTAAPGVVSNFGLFYTTIVIDAQFYGFMTLNPSNFFSNSYITSNGGSSWNLGDVPIAFGTSRGDLVFHDNKLNGIMISGGTIPNIKRTTNGGVNWVTINTMTDLLGFVTASWISGTNTVFIVSNNSLSERCVIRSDDAGLTWTSQNTASVIGLREMDYQRYDNRIIAYTISAVGNVLKSSQIVQPVGIQQIGTAIPLNYSLSQNYPNPFNPTTKINFDIPESGLVSLKIFDVNGREVRTLVNVVKTAGYYSLELDVSDISSGIYFYRIQSKDFAETKKMMLLK